ncbi:electron transport complex subunit RsxC [Shewanella litoralis]|uniref:Ion-translocating oxidoreductase complex subunit C n=1 Tax=Shewanella litoralis TaxID=2282700 RepID=A0ABQ2R3P0_9GAMM|nr:electron transport complex subunit RsxC [Shewanella litoralis]GGQ11899.1 electron transport complex subunit C [Shewanella litoralis]
MLTLLEQLDKGSLWQSPGGIHPPQLKTLSNQSAIARLPLATRFIVPVPLVGEQATLSVGVGDKVLKGQSLTEGAGFTYLPVHAPTSGQIVAIEQHATNHPSSLPTLSCIIESDGQDTWCDLIPNSLEQLSKLQILDKIKQAGIAGMGGAAFPSHVKLNPASEIDLVIINGIECEPYITSDDRLMRDHSDEIVSGVGVINHLLNPQRIIIAIEDNKPEAAQAMQAALNRSNLPKGVARVTVIPTKYPSGGEKQLIQIITGKEVPSGAIPAQLGIVVHNVGTAFAIQEAIYQGKPLIERVVTLTGEQIGQPGNYWLPIGTTVADALQSVHFIESAEQKVIVGGPMMGYALAELDVPILKGTNCLLVPSHNEIAADVDEKACIRCGECAVACPALLLPQQLFWHAKAEEYDKAASYNLKDCIECGCCSYVCPSDIPLVEYYRVAKSALKIEAEEKRQAEQAKIRFEARLQRLEDEKNAREAKAKEAAAKRQANMKSTDKDAVAAAMARIAAKKAQDSAASSAPTAGSTTQVPQTVVDPKKAAVNAAIERAKAKKAAQANTVSDDEFDKNTAEVNVDDKQAKIAAAVARAKAKKAAQVNAESTVQTPNTAETSVAGTEPPADTVDDKKVRVAAAVAKAKAKKLAQAGQTDDTTVTTEPTTDAVDDKKARVAAAVAKAKAKKLAQANQTDDTVVAVEPTTDRVDDKKASVAAAVAKAKAKKLAQASQIDIGEAVSRPTVGVESTAEIAPNVALTATADSAELSPEQIKKAKVAAAIAKAKAKKLANSAEQEEQ